MEDKKSYTLQEIDSKSFSGKIKTCGVVFMRKRNGAVELLLKRQPDLEDVVLDDIRTPIRSTDKSVLDAGVRYLRSSMNGKITPEAIKLVCNESMLVYNRDRKHMIFLVILTANALPESDSIYHPEEFGDRDTLYKYARTIYWYKFRDIKNSLDNCLSECSRFMDLCCELDAVE